MSDSKKKPQHKSPKKAAAKKAPAKKKPAAKKAAAKKAPAKKKPAVKKAPAKAKQSVQSSFDSVNAMEAHEMAHQMMAALDAHDSIKIDFLDEPQEAFVAWNAVEPAFANEKDAGVFKNVKIGRIKRFFRYLTNKSTK